MYMLVFVEREEFEIRWRFFNTLEKAQAKMIEYIKDDLGVDSLSEVSPYDFSIKDYEGWAKIACNDYLLNDNWTIYQIIEIKEG